MTSKQRQRFIAVIAIVLAVGAAVTFTTLAFRQNLLYYFTPSMVAGGEAPVGKPFRLGGLVVNGSIERSTQTIEVRFRITDLDREIPVIYRGILPDLFAEGKGVVTKGMLGNDGIFQASEVLAKHDENYMPPEVADSLRNKKGHPNGATSTGAP
jgi:cytochrome c-type biogenesis protein CcmE